MDDAPDLFGYADHRAYLSDWFGWKKEQNPRYSHRLFARRAGVSSAGLLSNVLEGRRNLTRPNAEGFARAIGLEGEAADFFFALVDLGQAADDAEREDAWERMWSVRRFREAHRLEGAGFRYLTRWHVPAIRELVACGDFREDPVWLASRLRPPITPAQAQEALDALFELGLLVRGEDGAVAQADTRLVTAQEVGGLAVRRYHQGMSERARDAVEGFTGPERHLLAVTVPIPESLVPRLKEELDAFQRRLLDLCDGADGPDRVYQINLQLFPLTARPEET